MEKILEKSVRVGNGSLAKLHEYHPLLTPTLLRSVRPFLHQETRRKLAAFLKSKQEQGNDIEKAVYKDMDVSSFVTRLLCQRPLSFVGRFDRYLLRDKVTNGQGGWDRIGTTKETPPLVLQDYLSYQEVELAALIGLGGYILPVNDGSRNNRGEFQNFKNVNFKMKIQNQKKHEKGSPYMLPLAYYCGMVGCRFEKPGVMENTPEFLGNFEANFKHRMRLVIEPFLCECVSRGEEQDKRVFVHCVGLGLGVWCYHGNLASKEDIALWQIQVYLELLNEIGEHLRSRIDVLYLAWFPEKSVQASGIYGRHKSGITVQSGKREPFAPLTTKSKRMICANFAWDGNSFVGNEYWLGSLCGSGDPAAVCCSQLGDTANPLVNPQFVSGDDARYYEISRDKK